MVFPQNFEQIIGFDVIRAEVNAHCISPLGTTHCEQMRFCLQPETIRQLLEETNEFVAILQSRRDFPINYYFDLRGALAAAQTPGSHLSADNLHRLQRLLQTIHDIRRFFDNNYPRIVRDIATMESAASSGNTAFKLAFTADYTLSKLITMSFYYDLQTNTPLLSSSSYPRQRTTSDSI